MWIKVAGADDPLLESELDQKVEAAVRAGKYSQGDVAYIARMNLNISPGRLEVSDHTLHQLRSLCQLWDVDIRLREIKSHRPLVGPIIVALKRMLYPALRVLLKDFIRQQRSFNAAVVALLGDLSNRKESVPGDDP
ncbi:MAG: hypothetical protein GX589_04525 [Deltaproteobacteria bacterium]|nr:hypothetical protein [Deltaproteobacteria bacterium]